MSQDLFSAFGSAIPQETQLDDFDQSWTQLATRGNAPLFPNDTQAAALDLNNEEDDDDFGDFEDASVVTTSQPVPEPLSQTSVKKALSPSELKSSTRKDHVHFPPKVPSSQPIKGAAKTAETGRHPFANHMDLLFETGDDEYDAGADELADLSNNPEAAMAYSKRIIAEQEAAHERAQSVVSKPITSKSAQKVNVSKPSSSKLVQRVDAKPQPNKLRKKSGYAPPTRNAEVLFDADNASEHDDEDFGQFEDWNEPASSTNATKKTITKKTAQSLPAMDLLGLDDIPRPDQHKLQTRSSQHAYDKTSYIPTQEAASQHQHVEEDAWDDFETTAPQSPVASGDGPAPSRGVSTQPARPSTQPDLLPPTNVPPPIILLALFQPLFSSADDALFDTLSKFELKQRQALLAHPASHQFLRGYLGHCNVFAHIIAGRKLRWKRDQRLSQSMRIGPAAAGGKGGMKLTGLDKSEAAKEDREIVDVLRLWKGQVGKLRTAVTAASAAPGLPKLPPVPDIAEQMPVKTLKQSEGGVTAPHACALCGLRREERVAKVDLEVEDSFGEWWVQGMNMHVVCKKFWEEFERKLKSR